MLGKASSPTPLRSRRATQPRPWLARPGTGVGEGYQPGLSHGSESGPLLGPDSTSPGWWRRAVSTSRAASAGRAHWWLGRQGGRTRTPTRGCPSQEGYLRAMRAGQYASSSSLGVCCPSSARALGLEPPAAHRAKQVVAAGAFRVASRHGGPGPGSPRLQSRGGRVPSASPKNRAAPGRGSTSHSSRRSQGSIRRGAPGRPPAWPVGSMSSPRRQAGQVVGPGVGRRRPAHFATPPLGAVGRGVS